MAKFLDTSHPWFRPLWVRLLTVAFPAGWGLFELWGGSTGWALAFLALAAYAAWSFFLDPAERRRRGGM